MAYSLAASQFDAIQYTGSNLDDLQTWLSALPSTAWGGPMLLQRHDNGQVLVLNGQAQLWLNENDWLVTTRATSGFPYELPGAPIAAGDSPSNIVSVGGDQFTAWFTA